mmetsp:Transcript_58520/g.104053  ORF Transcript_58520/g.104053 Transcript_58520/m.104053 type:complete len:246 (-) Transcript_58520:523-1260(-)
MARDPVLAQSSTRPDQVCHLIFEFLHFCLQLLRLCSFGLEAVHLGLQCIQLLLRVARSLLRGHRLRHLLCDACASKATCTSRRLLQGLHLYAGSHGDSFQHELCHPVTLRHREVLLAVIEENHAYLPAVVVVNNTCADLNHLLHSQTGPRRNPGVRVSRDGNGESSFDDGLTAGRHDNFHCRRQVEASCVSRAPHRQHGIGAQALDLHHIGLLWLCSRNVSCLTLHRSVHSRATKSAAASLSFVQ